MSHKLGPLLDNKLVFTHTKALCQLIEPVGQLYLVLVLEAIDVLQAVAHLGITGRVQMAYIQLVQEKVTSLLVDSHRDQTILVVKLVQRGLDSFIILVFADVYVVLFPQRTVLLKHDLIDPALAALFRNIQIGESQVITPLQIL